MNQRSNFQCRNGLPPAWRWLLRVVILLCLTSVATWGLDPSQPPSGNFDLSNFRLNLPVDSTGGMTVGGALEVKSLTNYSNSPYFYTASDGAMVLFGPDFGATTSTTVPRARCELREYLSSSSTGDWQLQLGTTHTMNVTLKVNKVPTLAGATNPSNLYQVAIGQIHQDGNVDALDAELVILMYRYDPVNYPNGDIYADIWSSNTSTASPVSPHSEWNNCGAPGSTINYTISVVGNVVTVTVNGVAGTPVVADNTWNGQHLYFKAGSYNQSDWNYSAANPAPQGFSTPIPIPSSDSTNSDGAQVSHYALTVNHANSSAAAFAFDTSGTWTCPANVTSVQVESWGGGGAGGSALRTPSSGSTQYGGGGAGGAYAKVSTYPVVPGNTYYINVGAGGVAATGTLTNGAAISGGDSWFNSVNAAPTGAGSCLAKGGAGGVCAVGNTSATASGAGGVGTAAGSLGDVTFAGGSGASGNSGGYAGGGGSSGGGGSVGISATPGSGTGAAAVTGGGNGGNPNATSGSSGTGQTPTTTPGGGGGGARATAQQTGGNGADGQVIITANNLTAGVILGSLAQTWSGTPISATATTNPTGLSVNFTYNGSATAPTAAGSYSVVATINDVNYAGTATGTLVIADTIADWRQNYFATTVSSGNAADTADPDGDGFTNYQEYVLGTNPTKSNAPSLLTATRSGGNVVLSFVANQASGPGCVGFTRYYTVQSTTTLSNSASWVPVTGYTSIAGANQTVNISLPATGGPAFYRLSVSLQ